MEKIKVEIIDNQKFNRYEINTYVLADVSKWYQKEKIDWKWESSHQTGKNYTCPEIHKGKITLEEYVERDVQLAINREGVSEVHRLVIEDDEEEEEELEERNYQNGEPDGMYVVLALGIFA